MTNSADWPIEYGPAEDSSLQEPYIPESPQQADWPDTGPSGSYWNPSEHSGQSIEKIVKAKNPERGLGAKIASFIRSHVRAIVISTASAVALTSASWYSFNTKAGADFVVNNLPNAMAEWYIKTNDNPELSKDAYEQLRASYVREKMMMRNQLRFNREDQISHDIFKLDELWYEYAYERGIEVGFNPKKSYF